MVENSFDDLKNALDINRIRVHTARRMDEMETLCRITYANRRGQLLTEMNKIQRRIVDVFGVKLPEC